MFCLSLQGPTTKSQCFKLFCLFLCYFCLCLFSLSRVVDVPVERDSSSPATIVNGLKVVKLSVQRSEKVSITAADLSFNACLGCRVLGFTQ